MVVLLNIQTHRQIVVRLVMVVVQLQRLLVAVYRLLVYRYREIRVPQVFVEIVLLSVTQTFLEQYYRF